MRNRSKPLFFVGRAQPDRQGKELFCHRMCDDTSSRGGQIRTDDFLVPNQALAVTSLQHERQWCAIPYFTALSTASRDTPGHSLPGERHGSWWLFRLSDARMSVCPKLPPAGASRCLNLTSPPINRPTPTVSASTSPPPSRPTSLAWPNSWPPRPTGTCSDRPSSRSATSSTPSGPRPSRPPPIAKKVSYDGSSRGCPDCHGAAKFHRWQGKRVVTAIGEVTVTRPYYDCPVCRAGHSPRDGQLGLTTGDLSRGAAELAALAGTLGSFAEAATKTLPKLAGLRISESTVERATERVGDHVGERLSAGDTFGSDRAWNWSEDADGKTCAYVSADLTGVGMQGPNGAKADGRMAAAGMVWNAGNDGQVRYVCGLTGGLASLGEPLRRQAGQVGMDRADRWIAISDGGSGIEDWLRTHFPRVEAVILDFLPRGRASVRVGQGVAPGRRRGREGCDNVVSPTEARGRGRGPGRVAGDRCVGPVDGGAGGPPEGAGIL